MNKLAEEYKQKAKRLLTVWVVSYILLGILSNIYAIYQRVVNQYNPIAMLSKYQLFSLFIMIFYFLPLLFYVIRFAKLGGMKKLYRISRIVFLLFSIWSLALFVLTVLALLNPSLF